MSTNRIYPHGGRYLGAIAVVAVTLSIVACLGIIYGVRHRLPLLFNASVFFNAILVGAACFLPSLMAARRKPVRPEADVDLTHLNRLALAGQISASIVHEIAQPISAILLHVEALEFWFASKMSSPAIAENILSDIKRDEVRTREMILRLRKFFSKGELCFESVDINELVAHAVEFLRPDLRRNQVAVETRLLPETLPASVDRVHLQQVLITLIVNAVEAMSGVPANLRRLQISTHGIGRHSAEIVVTDNGPEMTQDQFEYAFEPFFTTKKNSMGLGLSVARAIVLAHRGLIWIERRSQGASFHLEIPLSPAS